MTASSAPATAASSSPSGRLVSLDVFRGLTMALMVIVNNPGNWDTVYWPLLHAEWHGWTPTDLVFPFFLFIVGVSITLSRKSASAAAIAQRAAVIFAIGLFLNAYPEFELATLRIPGVLQRIAVCYLWRRCSSTRRGAARVSPSSWRRSRRRSSWVTGW